ncbi:MAG: hypothetical protein K1X47_17865, partial [Cyclobacteriaceae bacterium]|nr:hypothetical protein [Cyclobacteriaceae bacterium]
EDSLFVERLPAEGKRITRADRLQLDMLNEKISERFVNRALFQESYDILAAVVKRHAEPRWLDTLAKYKSELYQYIEKKKGEPTLARDAADTLGIPLPAAADKDFEEFSKDLNSRVSFMSFAQDGKYENAIEVPWSITYTNADSVAGSLAIWKPLVNKFVFRDYIMTVECRKLNWWAVVATLFLLAASGWLWFRKPE